MSEFQSAIKKLETNKAVKMVLVIDNNDKILYPDQKKENKKQHEHLISQISPLVLKAKHMVRNLDKTNDLTFLHFKSGKEEIMIAPGDNEVLISITDVSKLDTIVA